MKVDEYDEYLLNQFRGSDIADRYLLPDFDLEEIVRGRIPEIMYGFLTNLAEESVINVEKDKRIFKVLQYDLVEELCTQISPHEGILFLQSMLGDKFYRDHLKHMFRVMLLTHTIGDKLGLGKDKLLACTLAGLFHDMAYPLSKAKETIHNISESLKRCYPYFAIKGGNLQFLAGKDKINKILRICKTKKVGNLGKEPNHAILSAIVFLNFWNSESLKKDKNLRKIIHLAIHAIATHDSNVEVTYSRNPVGTILILADELQNWGRPVGWDPSWIAIRDIEPFEINKNEIRAIMDYSNSPEGYDKTYTLFSPLLQIESTQKNMSRICLNACFPNMRLTYRLPKYGTWSKDSVLSYAREIEGYIKGIEMTLTAKECRLSGAMPREIPPDLYVFEQLQDWFQIFYDRVAKSSVPLYLHYNLLTGEYVVDNHEKMPSKIIADKNGKGKVEWNYVITKMKKPVEGAATSPILLGLKTGRFLDISREYRINYGKAIRKLEAIDDSQIRDNFIALLQLIPDLYYTSEEIVKEGYGKEPDHFVFTDKSIDLIMTLQYSWDPRYHFFLGSSN